MGKMYEMAFSIGAKVNGNFGAAFRSAAQSVQSLQTTIDQLNKRQSDISSYERTQSAIEKVTSKLDLYQQQYANLKREIEESGNASAKEQNQLLAKGKAIDDAKQKLGELQEKLQKTGEALQAEGVDLDHLGEASKKAADDVQALRKEQEDIISSSDKFSESTANMAESLMDVAAATHVIDGLKKIGEAFKACAEESIAFENSMASVKRTVGGSDNFINQLGDDFKTMSTQIPITTGELAQIATTAGQLGIAQDKVESFTTVMAKLATTTDLSADEAATMLAQFSNVTGVRDYERLGATIAKLGDATATTASKVTQMSQGMAASASLAGMKPTDIMAISAAVGSLGIEAGAGSTAMSTLINNIYKATETGEKLSDFASVAGMSAETFKQAWSDDAAGALNSFIQGLNDVERNGKSAIVLLDELGINNVRQTKAILGLASAGDLLSNTLSMANEAWEENTALDEKAGIMYETTQAKITMLENSFSNLKTSIGDAFTPAIASAAEGLTNLIQPVSEFIETNPALVQGLAAAIGVVGGLTAAMMGYAAAAKLAAAASAALTAVIPGAKAALVAGAAFSAIIGLAVGLGEALQESNQSFEELDANFDSLVNKAQEQQNIINLCKNYRELAEQVDHTVDVSKKMEDFQDVDISLSAEADASVSPTDFLADGNTSIELDGVASGLISGIDFIVGGTDEIPLDGKADGTITGDDLVSDKGVHLHVDENGVTKLDADAFVNGKEIAFTATWENKAAMEADIAKFKQDAQNAQTELKNGKDMLKELYDSQDALIARIQHAPSDMAKDSLTSQLNAVRDAIGQQEGKVNDLTAAYDKAAAKYLIAAQAAETLKNHTDAIAEAQAALGISADSTADSYQREADAINALVDAKEREARANLAAIRGEVFANGAKMAKSYAQAVRDGSNANREYTQTERDAAVANKYATQSAKEVSERYDFLLKNLNQMQDEGKTGTQLFSDYLTEANSLHNVLEGTHSELSEIQDELQYGSFDFDRKWGSSFDDSYWEYVVSRVNEGVKTTSDSISDAEVIQQTYVENMVNAVNTGAFKLDEIHEKIIKDFADEENGAEMAEDAFNRVKAAVDSYNESANAASGSGMTAEEAQAQLQPIIDNIENLSKAYKEAYESAYQSINGQFGLFENVPLAQASKDAESAVDNMISALTSQGEYIDQYLANLAEAENMHISEGLIKALSDGSEESAQILADLVAGGADKVDELNQAFGNVERGKQKFADSIAEMQTDFTNQMNVFKAQLETTVAAMDKSSEARKSGESTVKAFAEAASGQIGTVSAVFAQLSAAATIKASFSLPKISASFLKLFGFASGTPSAPPGYALVGEEGPELVKLRGGERILNADDTKQALDNSYESAQPVNAIQSVGTSNNVYSIDFKPQYNITGSMNADELRASLETYTAGIRGELEDMLDDIENDRNRRKYA